MQKVVHIRERVDGPGRPGGKYIGRGPKWNPSANKWGNPYVVGEHGSRGECVQLYREWICRGEGRRLLSELGELEGETLVCFCAPKGGVTHLDHAPDQWICHGQVLLALLAHRRQKIGQKS